MDPIETAADSILDRILISLQHSARSVTEATTNIDSTTSELGDQGHRMAADTDRYGNITSIVIEGRAAVDAYDAAERRDRRLVGLAMACFMVLAAFIVLRRVLAVANTVGGVAVLASKISAKGVKGLISLRSTVTAAATVAAGEVGESPVEGV